MTLIKVLLLLAVISNILAYVFYLYSMFKGRVKPHALTFLAWSLVMSINFFIQYFSGVGEGTMLLGTNAVFCFIVFAYCIIKKDIRYDRIDWLCLALAILAIILYLISTTPIYSAMLSCLIDIFAFAPSFRKSYKKPHDDSVLTFIISGFEYIFSFPAYGVFSFIVLAYPVTVLTLDFAYAGMILLRRRRVKSQE